MFNFFRKTPKEVDVFRATKASAESGNALAQFDLGTMYVSGEGVQKNVGEAIQWYKKSADQGHPTPQFILGVIYMAGEIVPRDLVKAVHWFRKAAEHEHAGAQSKLGLLCSLGEGAPQNDIEAVYWYKKAAEQGFAEAQGYLAVMYMTGRGGLCQDYVEGYKWINLAARDGDTLHVKTRDSICQLITPEQIAEGQRRSAVFVPLKKQ